ncbi:hypothetical protein K438DRAFT_1969837 [Mycena galopus ATCC 62051]|nr:hypothetical protein K438DRAFT_1969837 [Mycena galopus ATCC 62051]
MSNNPNPEQTGETPTAGTTQFASATSNASQQEQLPAAPEPRRRFKLHVDIHGVSYLRDTTTGDRYELSEDEMELNSPLPDRLGAATDATPSSPSSLTEPPPNITGEEILAVLVADLQNGPLTVEQARRFNSIRGMLSLTRESLLTTTGLVAGQRYKIGHLSGSLHMLRDEVSNRMDALSEAMVGASHKLESALENNLRILRAMGATDMRLAELSASIRGSARQPVMPTAISPVQTGPLAPPTDMEEQQPSIDRALPPQRANESNDAFERRARALLNRRENAANPHTWHDTHALTLWKALPQPARVAQRTQPPAPPPWRRTIPPPAEKMAQISRIIERQLGEVMEAPPKAPRMRDPPMYKGEDDDEAFMAWFGRLVTFLQGYSMGGPKYDINRIVYLKSALDSHALEWFSSEVEPIDRDSDIPYEFESIICAMHRRFVTSATATKATKDFEGVRYDPARGIEHLVSELRRTAGKMREPPAEFTIRQRFMRLIPSDAHDELISRGMRPEYTELELLKNNARVWLEGRSMLRSGTARAAPRVAVRMGTPRGVPKRQVTLHAVSWAPVQAPAVKVALNLPRTAAIAGPRTMPPTTSGTARTTVPNSAKTCFSCGQVGHIASDPRCPKFNESASRAPRPALRAGRVESSYSVDNEYEPEDTQLNDGDPVADDLEGTWGGGQYEADELLDRHDYPADYDAEDPIEEGDPHEAPDLETLLQDDSAPEIRVGATRPMRRYFAMRVTPTTDLLPEGPMPSRGEHQDGVRTGSRQRMLDTDVIVLGIRETGHELWTANGEHRVTTERGIGWDTGIVSHEQLLSAFYEQHGNDAPIGAIALELEAVEAIGAEEHARTLWDVIIQSQPLMIVGFSPNHLRSTAVDVETELLRFEQLFSSLQQTIVDLRGLRLQRQLARVGIKRKVPRGSETGSRSRPLLERALAVNQTLISDMTLSIYMLEHRLTRIGRTRRALEEEGTRRALEREEFLTLLPIFSTRESAGHPAPSSPPSYPGSPHDSDEYYPADEAPILSRVRHDSEVSGTVISTVSSLSDSTDDSARSDGEVATAILLPIEVMVRPGAEEIILRSVEILTSRNARRVITYVTPNGDLRVERMELPRYHRLHPEFQEEHRLAMELAITELAAERH